MEYKCLMTLFYIFSGLRPGLQISLQQQTAAVHPKQFVLKHAGKKKWEADLLSEPTSGLKKRCIFDLYIFSMLVNRPGYKLLNRLHDPVNNSGSSRRILVGLPANADLSSITSKSQEAYCINASEKAYNIHFTISKQWYKSGWAFALIAVSLLVFYGVAAKLKAQYSRKYRDKLAQERAYNLRHAILLLNSSKKRIEREQWLHAQLLSSISHDIRTPLGFVNTMSGEIKQLLESNQNKQAAEAIEVISYTINEIVNLTGNITSFMKASLYGKQITWTSVNLKELMMQKTKVFNHILAVQKGHLSIEIPEDLIIHTNPDLLGILIYNLVDNALKVSRENHTRVSAILDGGKTRLVVSDQGSGMPADVICWLSSETSFRANTLKGSFPSLGLGLILVKEIAQMLHIKISAENMPGANVSLRFEL